MILLPGENMHRLCHLLALAQKLLAPPPAREALLVTVGDIITD